MERKTYLSRYQIAVNGSGLPVEIQRSASGVVYKGEDTSSGEEVALEVLPAGNLNQSLRQRLEVEAHTAKRLNHINIPVLHDFGFEGDEMVYVTESFEGTTAEDWVKLHGSLPTATMLRVALQAVSALGAAAFHGIFHYAINPRNIMLVPGQTPQGDWPLIKVLHFVGLAPPLRRSPAVAAANPAAPVNFASPEQQGDGKVDFRSEMYSLGCVLSFLLTGESPQAGAATVEKAGGMAGSVKRLLSQMLAADPDERPLDPLALQQQIQDCITHLERLQSVASKFGLAAPSSTTPIQAAVTPAAVARKRSSGKPLALAALLLALGVLAVLFLPDQIRKKDNVATTGEEAIGVPVGVSQYSGARDDEPVVTVPDARQTADAVSSTTRAPALGDTQSADAPPPAAASVVPSPSAPLVADDTSALPALTPASSPVDSAMEAPAVASNEANPPVVTSIVESSPSRKGEASSDVAVANEAVPSPEVADNAATDDTRNSEPPLTAPRVEETSPGAPIQAENPQVAAEEAEPPFEGPTEVAASDPAVVEYSEPAANEGNSDETSATQGETSVAQWSDDETDESGPAAIATSKQSSEAKDRKAATASAKKKLAAKRKETPSRPAKEARVASADARPPVPRGAVRAEFLGTTADGNLIFGLPKAERGYVAAPASGREGASRRRARRVLTEPVSELTPVLPALPPDE